jgi:hypothetical protein
MGRATGWDCPYLLRGIGFAPWIGTTLRLRSIFLQSKKSLFAQGTNGRAQMGKKKKNEAQRASFFFFFPIS